MDNGRIETKYLVKDVSFIKEVLDANFTPDKLYPFNYVFTLHFDTCLLDSYFDKLSGFLYKNKIRVRWYSDTDRLFIPGDVYLENKTKRINRCFKYRLRTDLPEELRSEIFVSPRWDGIMLKNAAGLRSRLGRHLFPAMISSYRRRRFHDPFSGSDISLDDDIRIHMVNPAMARDHNIHPPLGEGVLEVKGQSPSLPPCLENLDILSMSAFSKYEALLTNYTGGRNE